MVNLGWRNDHLQFMHNQAHLSIQEFDYARILASWNHGLFARPLLIFGSQIRDLHTVMMQPCNNDQGCILYVMQNSLKVLRQLGQVRNSVHAGNLADVCFVMLWWEHLSIGSWNLVHTESDRHMQHVVLFSGARIYTYTMYNFSRQRHKVTMYV